MLSYWLTKLPAFNRSLKFPDPVKKRVFESAPSRSGPGPGLPDAANPAI